MTKAEIWDSISGLPFTPAGIAERMRLLEMVPDDLSDEDKQHEQPKTITKPLRAREPNWYHGIGRTELERWIRLREAGVVADIAWWRGDRATGIRCRRIRLVEPMQCRPVPDGYTGKLNEKGMW